jgi:hypothetical protein
VEDGILNLRNRPDHRSYTADNDRICLTDFDVCPVDPWTITPPIFYSINGSTMHFSSWAKQLIDFQSKGEPFDWKSLSAIFA